MALLLPRRLDGVEVDRATFPGISTSHSHVLSSRILKSVKTSRLGVCQTADTGYGVDAYLPADGGGGAVRLIAGWMRLVSNNCRETHATKHIKHLEASQILGYVYHPTSKTDPRRRITAEAIVLLSPHARDGCSSVSNKSATPSTFIHRLQ